jgi:tRNA-uridine aminocarboxypropyltransferase
MNIFLLTHSRELNKATNTGSLVARVMGNDCRIIVWDRVVPDRELLNRIENESVVLLYPSEEAELLADDMSFDNCIIIDGTWQEAQKIYNKSPYLKKLKKIKIENEKKSVYTLRRNQKEMGLCTAECAIEILNASGCPEQAKEIEKNFLTFLNQKKTDQF